MNDSRRERWMLITASLVILASVALGFVLWFTRSVMIPFVLAVFVVAVVAPISDFLQKNWRFPRWLSMVCVLLMLVVLAVGVSLLLAYTANQVLKSVDGYTSQVHALVHDWLIANTAPDANRADPPGETGIWFLLDPNFIGRQVDSMMANVDAVMKDAVRWGIGSAVGIVSTVVMMIIFAMFLLAGLDPKRMQQGVYAEIESKIRRYLSIKTAVSAMTGLLVGSLLGIMELQLATVFGVLTFLLNFVPSLGSIIATLLPIPVAVSQFVLEDPENANWWNCLAVVALPGMVQIVIGNVVEPRVMGEGLDLHPIVILIALVFWGLLWGPIGAILAVPITAVIRIAVAQFASLRPVGDAMAGRLPG